MLLQGPLFESIIAFLAVVLVCLPIHEFGHAWTAVKLGDSLPAQQGRVTLNPLKHVDWLGAALLAVAGFGWAKPVQFNPYALYKAPSMRTGVFVVASAGPIMNVLLAVAAALPFRLGLVELRDVLSGQAIAFILYVLISINLLLAVFNLIPIPPLDGSKILAMLLPGRYDSVMLTLSQYGPFILLLMIVPLFGGRSLIGLIITPVVRALTQVLLGL